MLVSVVVVGTVLRIPSVQCCISLLQVLYLARNCYRPRPEMHDTHHERRISVNALANDTLLSLREHSIRILLGGSVL